MTKNTNRSIHFGDKVLPLLGPELCAGQTAPDFTAINEQGEQVSLSQLKGLTLILSVVPSINTPVCQVQTRKFNQEAEQLGEGVLIVTVSRDKAADFTSFCAAEGITRLLNLSDLQLEQFGETYGFRIDDAEIDLLARGIIVINPEGNIAHIEYVPELADEPNYAPALDAARATAGAPFHQLPLPYAKGALAPVISEETIEYHYGKHLQTYVDNLNRLTADSSLAAKSVEELVCEAEGAVFNNAGQIYNHRLYFNSFAPAGCAQAEPTGSLLAAIEKKWGSYAGFQEEMTASATTFFGSGWLWLVSDDAGDLSIVSTVNAGCPLRDGFTPLFVIDVWEHAYYVDYRNARAGHLKALWAVVNWKAIEPRYKF